MTKDFKIGDKVYYIESIKHKNNFLENRRIDGVVEQDLGNGKFKVRITEIVCVVISKERLFKVEVELEKIEGVNNV